ncbi:MAG: alanine--glyoxylate aminotransferase family protein [Bdellovibrionaceae bacterium]|nr:alanine--glyoxylate aminotransferase family protein [Pseudobdellovibrionaceae bacterium]
MQGKADHNYDYTLMAPGPVNLHPKVREILSEPMIHHRTPEFDKILAQALKRLKFVFQTAEPVYMISSTGSGGMESLLVNTLSPGDTILAVNSGKFGERWIEMAKTFGVHVDELKITWGDAVSADVISEKLKTKAYHAILTQACETSTGVLHPIQKIGEIVKAYPGTLLLVDAITALGAVPLPMDEWHIDGLVGGSQKAFMLPTGMSFVSFSKKAQATFANSKIPKFYLDIKKEIAANSKGETFFSSNVTLTKALNFVLAEVEKQGLDSLFKSIQRRADFTAEMIQLLELKSYAKVKSASLTAVVVPEFIDGQKLRELIESEFNLTLMGGQDQAKGKIVRIGHMGYILDEHLHQLATALYRSLEKMGYKPATAFEAYTQRLIDWLKTH